MAINAKYTGLQDPQDLALDYELSSKVWNKDLRVSRAAIEIVLQNSPIPNAPTANPDDFYDKSLIEGSTRPTPASCSRTCSRSNVDLTPPAPLPSEGKGEPVEGRGGTGLPERTRPP